MISTIYINEGKLLEMKVPRTVVLSMKGSSQNALWVRKTVTITLSEGALKTRF